MLALRENMPSLKALQENLLQSIMGNNLSPEFIKQNNGIDIADRLEVHRDTVLENFISSLKITYPGVWKLIGDDCARGVALAYSHDLSNLKTRAEINSFGDEFPEFLNNFESTKHLQYLYDFATLELFRSKSYGTIKESYLSTDEMQDFFINGDEGGKLKLNSSTYFLESKFPLMNIQELLDNPEINELVIKNSASYIVVCRVQGIIETLYLSKNQWQFLYSLKNSDTIGKAMESFTSEEVEIELSLMIQLLISKQMIKGISR